MAFKRVVWSDKLTALRDLTAYINFAGDDTVCWTKIEPYGARYRQRNRWKA